MIRTIKLVRKVTKPKFKGFTSVKKQKTYLNNYGDQALPPVASCKSTQPTCLPGIGLYANTFSPIVSDHLKEVIVKLLIVFRNL